ncbi:MAG: hypothetical protein ABIH46_10995, partial [Chloroflexota bacterium]
MRVLLQDKKRLALVLFVVWVLFMAPSMFILLRERQRTAQSPEGRLLSREDAVTKVLENYIRPTDDHPMIARVWPQPLTPNDSVSGAFEDEAYRPGGSEWFVWIDDAPGAFFSHPTRYVFVDRSNGSVRVLPVNEAPLLNGEPMWESAEKALDSSLQIFNN